MTRFSRLSVFATCAFAVVVSLWLSQSSLVQAQPGRSKAKPKTITPAELKKLDAKLEDVQRSFLRDTDSIIKGYEESGQYERAKILLEVLLKLDPKNDAIKKKLEHLDDQILDSSQSDMELDPSKGWQQVGLVVKDRLVRIESEGDFKFVSTLTVGADGVPAKDPVNEMANAPLGAVVAMILPPGGGGGGGGNQKQPNVFFVGSKYEQPANRDGMLMLKVNVPPGSKCTGKLKVTVGGVTKST